jgi:methionyl-tRNA synthetase
MSKSLGNFVDLERIDRYVSTYGLDAFRYFLASHGPLGGNDSDFADAKFVEVYNTQLANDLGNLVNRSLSMVNRYRGAVPGATTSALRPEAEKMIAAFRQAMERLDLTGALDHLRRYVTRANQYVEETAPWKLAKDPAQAGPLDAVLYDLAESVRLIAILITPVMPAIAGQIRAQLGAAKAAPALADARWGVLPAGAKLGTVAPLFPKQP